MTSPEQEIASIQKPVKWAPEEQQRYLSTMIPLRKIPKTIKSAPDEQQRYLSTMIPRKGNYTDPEDDKIGSRQQRYLSTVIPLRKRTASIRETAKSAPEQQQRYLSAMIPLRKETSRSRKRAKPAPEMRKLVKKEGGYWVWMGEQKSQLSSQRKDDGIRRGQNRNLCISIGIIVGLIVLAGAAAGVYFFVFSTSASTPGTAPSTIPSTTASTIPSKTSSTTSSPTTSSTLSPILDEGLLAYEAICVPQSIKYPPITPSDVNLTECITGPPPRHDSCSGRATCIVYEYRVWSNPILEKRVLEDKTVYVTMTYDKEVVPKGKKNATQLLCRTTSPDKLGLCNRSTCTGARVEDDSSWYNESKWEDNCGQPNPCWQDKKEIELWSLQFGFTPAVCLTLSMDTITCDYGTGILQAVVVWIQHLRCDSGKDRSRTLPCTGLPLKLWVCANCSHSVTFTDFVNDQCMAGVRIIHACAFWCFLKKGLRPTYQFLADGAPCLNRMDGFVNTGYCFREICFHNFTVLNQRNRHELEKIGCRNNTPK